jgi:hypothetical protein
VVFLKPKVLQPRTLRAIAVLKPAAITSITWPVRVSFPLAVRQDQIEGSYAGNDRSARKDVVPARKMSGAGLRFSN